MTTTGAHRYWACAGIASSLTAARTVRRCAPPSEPPSPKCAKTSSAESPNSSAAPSCLLPAKLRTPGMSEQGGLYVHLPFCPYICPYCDFAKWPARASAMERYMDALDAEIDATSPRPATTLFLGGRTP